MSDTVSTLAQKLRPYWLRDAGGGGIIVQADSGGMVAHALSGPFHSGELAQTQATWASTKVELQTHAADPDAHHNRATGLAGVVVSNDQKISVGQGEGILVNSTNVAINPTLAGLGLTYTNGVVNVQVANTGATGLSVEADTVRLTSSSDPGQAAKILATNSDGGFNIDTDLLVVDGANRRVGVGRAPLGAALDVLSQNNADHTLRVKQRANQTGRLWRVENADGDELIVLDSQGNLQSGRPGFVSGLTGWQISSIGNAEFNNIWARGELHASIFVMDEFHSSGGTLFIAPAGKLENDAALSSDSDPALTNVRTTAFSDQDFLDIRTESAAGSGDQITARSVENWIDITDPPSGHAQVFAVGDRLRCKTLAMGAGLDVYDIWMLVRGIQNMTDFYRYRVTILAGTLPVTLPAGSAVINYRKAGDGLIMLTSDQNYAPFQQVMISGAQPWLGEITPTVRLGRLDGVGLPGISGIYQHGIVLGKNLADANSPYFVASDLQLSSYRINSRWNDGSNDTVQIDASGRVRMGTNIGQAATTGFDFDPQTGVLQIGAPAYPYSVKIYGELFLPSGQPIETMRWRGAWASGTAYAKQDAVSYGGKSYITDTAHTAAAGNAPGLGAMWSVLADQGAAGSAAKLVKIAASAQVFAIAANGTAAPTSITFSASGQNVSGSPTYSITAGTGWALSGAGGNVLNYASGGSDLVTVQVAWDGLTDTITIAKVRDGATGAQGATGPAGASIAVRYSGNGTSGWHTTFTAGDLYMQQSTDGGATWSAAIRIVGETGPTGAAGAQGPAGADGTLVQYVFKRSASQPTTPTGNGVPAGWFDAPPVAGSDPHWMSKATQTLAGVTQGAWSAPVRLTGETGATGAQGPQGNQGVAGPAGADGAATYTWIAYADSADGLMSFTTGAPGTRRYIGIAHNKTTATEGANAADYTWSRYVGDQGIQGPAGADGQPTYTWIAYADSADGATNFTTGAPGSRTYIGIAHNKVTATESSTPGDYTWSRYVGPQGIQGPAGANGQTSYFHVAYASNNTGTVGFNQTGGAYIGTYVDYSATDSTDPAAYTWRQFVGSQGLAGSQGIAGVNGADGQTSYLHIKYSNDGGANFTTSNGETPGAWLGTYVDFTAADSSSVGAYTWVKIEGPAGSNAKLVKIVASSQVFAVSVAGVATPTSITLTASGQNLSGSPSFAITAGTGWALTGTGNSRTLAYAAGGSTSVTIQVTWDGQTDSVTIAKVFDGATGATGAAGAAGATGAQGLPALTVVLGNEAHTLPADSLGNVTNYAGSGTTVVVYEGATPLAAGGSGAGTFTVAFLSELPINVRSTAFSDQNYLNVRTTSASGSDDFITARSRPLTPGAVSYAGNVATIADHAGVNASADVLTLAWTVTVTRTTGQTATFVRFQTITKSKAAPSLLTQYSVNGSTGWHSTFASGDLFMRQSADAGATWATAVRIVGEQGAPGAGGNVIQYIFKRSATQPSTPTGDNIPTGWSDAPPAGTDLLWMSRATQTPAGITQGAWSAPVRLTGDTGIDGLTVVLSNEATTLPASSAGAVSSYAGSGTTVIVYEGATQLTGANGSGTNGTFWINTPTVSPTGKLTVGARNNGVVADHSAMDNATDAVTITYPISVQRLNGTVVTVNRVQTVTKSKAGAQGPQGPQGPQGIQGLPGLDNQGFAFLVASEASMTGKATGLYMTADKVGFWTGAQFNSYIDNAGNFKFGATGAIEYSSSANQLRGRNGTTTQWYVDGNNGRFIAGAGAVEIDANGQRITRPSWTTTAGGPEPLQLAYPLGPDTVAQAIQFRDTAAGPWTWTNFPSGTTNN
nr:hypothetical protein [Caldilineaceae bacterium]